MYYVAETQIQGRKAKVSHQQSADLQLPASPHVKMQRAVENFRRLSAKKASDDATNQVRAPIAEHTALVPANGTTTPLRVAPSEGTTALAISRTDLVQTQPDEIDLDEPDPAEPEPAYFNRYDMPLQGEILAGDAPDPEARVVTPGWATNSRDLTPKRPPAPQARDDGALATTNRPSAACEAKLLATELGTDLVKKSATPETAPPSEVKALSVDAVTTPTESIPDPTSRDPDPVLAKIATKPEGVAPSAETDLSADSDQADAKTTKTVKTTKTAKTAKPKKPAKTTKTATRPRARKLSRADAAALAEALKTAEPLAEPKRAIRSRTDHVADAPTAQPEIDPGVVEFHPSMPKVNPNLVFGATMALWRAPRFTSQELLNMINVILEGTGAIADYDQNARPAGGQQILSRLKRRLGGLPSATLRVNGLLTLVGGGDKPAFVGKALEERINPALWSEGVKCMSMSRGYVMIADAQPGNPIDPDLNYDRAVAVTVTAMAVSLLTDPVGIIWHPAGNATPPDVIPDFIQSLTQNMAPLPLWLRWLVVPSTDGRSPGAASRGLLALLGMELEMAPNDSSLEKTVADLFQFAAVHVKSGKVPPDGSQVRAKDKTWYLVSHHQRGAVTNTPVFRLTPVLDYVGEKSG